MEDTVTIKPVIAKKHKGRFPKYIKLAGIKIPIYTCVQIKVTDSDTQAITGYAHGAYNGEEGQIFITHRVISQLVQESLLHECVHAIDTMYKLDLTEEQVKQMSISLYDLLINNPIFRRTF